MRSRLSSLVLLTILTALAAAKGSADVSVNAAWESWKENNTTEAEAHFLKALEKDPAHLRANIGLAYLYQNDQNYDKAWSYYRNVLKHEDGPAYIFAGWNSGRMALVQNDSTSGLINVFKEMSDKADKNDMLTAMAHQSVGDYYRNRGDLAKSDAYYARTKMIRDWQVIGPFENVSASGFNKTFPPEKDFNPKKKYSGKSGAPANWFTITKTRPDGWIDFRRYFSVQNAVFYGNTFIQSPRKQKVHLRIGTSGSLKAFLNDEEVIAYEDENNNDLDTYIVETELQKGWNRLLIKVGFSEISQCNFMVRITDTNERDLNLPVSSAKKSYKKRPGAPTKTIENFAETFFQNKIKENPDHLENYLLLADTYLRNDKAIEGELVLRDALEKAPDCALFYLQLLEAYRRGEKDDDVATALEKATALDPDGVVSLVYKYEQALENSQIDQAEKLLGKLEEKLAGTPSIYQMRIGFYSNKREIEKLIATSKEAYEKFPNNWQFVSLEANISIQTTSSYAGAIELYKAYMENNYNATVLSNLASTYLKGSDVESWELYYRKILELDETARGSYYHMASQHFTCVIIGRIEE
ncbi:MAG: tetratricopeptide repeat protein [Calditrichota bacterium]